MKTMLRSQEFTCPSCVTKIEKTLKWLQGVQDARVHFTTGRIEVEHDPQRVSANELAQAVRAVGYTANVVAF